MGESYYKDIDKMVEMRKKQDERDYIGLINAGVTAQIEKLKKNEHKPPIESHTFIELFELLREEMSELTDELLSEFIDYSLTRHEAADLANICHAIILKCEAELNKSP
jgi:hypothetical protein